MEITIEGLDKLQAKMRALGMLRGIEARVGNTTTYAPVVGAARFQAKVHQGRWTTDEQAIANQRNNIEGDFQEAVNAALDAPVILRNPLAIAAHAAMLRLQTVMSIYPPPTGGNYRRTGTYGRKWTTSIKETSG